MATLENMYTVSDYLIPARGLKHVSVLKIAHQDGVSDYLIPARGLKLKIWESTALRYMMFLIT